MELKSLKSRGELQIIGPQWWVGRGFRGSGGEEEDVESLVGMGNMIVMRTGSAIGVTTAETRGSRGGRRMRMTTRGVWDSDFSMILDGDEKSGYGTDGESS